MKKRFVIFGAGEMDSDSYQYQPGDYLLAADGGLRHLQALGLQPDGILGDFDSLGYIPRDSQVFPVEKDDTDSMLAIRKGLELGYDDFLLLGCMDGERLDHTFANVQALLFLARQGKQGWLLGQKYACTVLCGGGLRFPKESRGILSLFCIGREAENLRIQGLQYRLENSRLSPDFPLGVSNHFVGEIGEISLDSGDLLVLWDRENGFPEVL